MLVQACGQAADIDREIAWRFGQIHQLQRVGVFDPAVGGFAQQGAAVAQHIDQQQRALGQGPRPEAGENCQQRRVSGDPRALLADGVLYAGWMTADGSVQVGARTLETGETTVATLAPQAPATTVQAQLLRIEQELDYSAPYRGKAEFKGLN